MGGIALIYVTFSSFEEAERIISVLLEKQLIACANTLPITSQYRWEGAVQSAAEQAAILKTTANLVTEVENAVAELHSYDVPCIVVLPTNASEPFAQWIANETRPD